MTSGETMALPRMLSKISPPSDQRHQTTHRTSLRRRSGIWVLMDSSSSMYFCTKGARELRRSSSSKEKRHNGSDIP